MPRNHKTKKRADARTSALKSIRMESTNNDSINAIERAAQP